MGRNLTIWDPEPAEIGVIVVGGTITSRARFESRRPAVAYHYWEISSARDNLNYVGSISVAIEEGEYTLLLRLDEESLQLDQLRIFVGVAMTEEGIDE